MCPPQVREQLMLVSGVEDATIDFEKKTATVKVKKGTSPDLIAAGLSGKFAGKLGG